MAQLFSGKGDDVVSLLTFDEPRILTARNSGQSIFSVELIDQNGESMNAVIHLGKYSGSVIVNEYSNYSVDTIQVKSDGSWEIEIDEVESAPLWEGQEIKGNSPMVIQLPSSIKPNNKMSFKCSGKSIIFVTTHNEYGDQLDLKVSAMDSYQGNQLIGQDVRFIQINTHGKWSLNII